MAVSTKILQAQIMKIQVKVDAIDRDGVHYREHTSRHIGLIYTAIDDMRDSMVTKREFTAAMSGIDRRFVSLETDMTEVKEVLATLAQTCATTGELHELRDEFKSDIYELRGELESGIQGLRGEFKSGVQELKTELKSDMQELKTELRREFRDDIQELRDELKADIQELRTELKELKDLIVERLSPQRATP